MAGTGNEIVETIEIDGEQYDVYGCWYSDTPEYSYDFYDVQRRSDDCCINLGEPFWKRPTRAQIIELLTIMTEG